MRSLNRNARDRASGFSLIEMMTVLALTIVATAIAFVSLGPAITQQHVTNAYDTTLAAMRQARDNAVSQRTSYSVTFFSSASPIANTVTVAPTAAFQGAQSTLIYQLPTDVAFLAQAGFPSPGPDGFGTGVNGIDFGYTASSNAGGQTVIYFCPDGSAQTTATCAGSGNWDNGVVYIGLQGNMLSSRAIDLWGGTGRLHGWRLFSNGVGGYKWQRQ